MSLYAIINSGTVGDLVSLPEGATIDSLGFLSDSQKANAVIVPDDQAHMVSVGWLYYGGEFSPDTPPAPPLTPAQQATIALNNGLAVKSTSTPSIDATYSTAGDSQSKITSVCLYITVNSKFPGGQSSYTWPDINGTPKVFPKTELFLEWSSAIADYISTLDNIILTNTGSLPKSSVTIA